MTISRRTFNTAMLGAAMAQAGTPAMAQKRAGIIMLAFAGGTSAAWRDFYLKPFQEKTSIPTQVVEFTDPTPWYMGRGSEFNCSISNPVDYVLYQQGKVEAMALADYPVLQKISKLYWTPVDDKHVLGMPVYYQAYGIAINTKFVKRGDIKSWMDLTKPEFKGKVGLGNFPDIYEVPWFSKITGGSEAKTASGLDLYKKISANALTIPGSMAQMVQMLQRGDIIAAPFYSSRVWTLRKGGDTSVDMVIPDEGAPVIPYHLQLSKQGPDMEAARQFASFSGGAEPSEKAADAIGYLPVNADAAFPADFQKIMSMSAAEFKAKLKPLDYIAIGKQRMQLKDQVDQINASIRR